MRLPPQARGTIPLTLFDSQSRDQLRLSYAEAWRKHLARTALTPLESMIADVIALHPQYHALIEDLGKAPAFEYGTESTAENPFFHMGLHLAVREQVSIDGPRGIRELHRLLRMRISDAHHAEHALTEALSATLWEAQGAGRAPDEALYLRLARRRLASAGKK